MRRQALLPANNGTNELKLYNCKPTHRLKIPGTELSKLLDLGYKAERVMPTIRKYQRQALKFDKVKSITKLDKAEPTYCCTVPSNNKAVFNNILTGQCEFIVPTKPLSRTPDSNIGICILTNINQAEVSIAELPHYTDLVVRAQNAIMHRQTHPTEEANQFVRNYSTIGIGFSNHAYWLAKNNWKYGDEYALHALAEWTEHFQYGLLRASNELSMETSPAPYFDRTSYAYGHMPLHRSGRNSVTQLPWHELAKNIIKHGLANCALSMIPPSETSSVIGNQTSGVEPIRDLLTIKDSKTGNVKQYVPEAKQLGHRYDFAFESKDFTSRYFQHISVIQSIIDMGISANTYYNPELYSDGKVDINDILSDIFLAHDLNIKTIYYSNVYVEDTNHLKQDDTCTSGGCEV